MGLKDFLKKVIDPVGPIGEVVSPADVYKTRLGLPISSPHTMRATVTAPQAEVEKALAPARFVDIADAVEVPKDRVRQVSAFIEERWHPIYASTDSTSIVEILKASETQIGWKVTQQQTVSSRPRLTAEQFIEVAQSCQIQASDEFYNGYYETIDGNDPVMINGEVLRGQDGTIVRGGTQIKGGRAEYAEKTKGMVHWDKSVLALHRQAVAEMESRPVRNVARAMDYYRGESLPMHRPTGIHFRKDRRSGV